MKKLFGYFIKGLLFLLPFIIAVYLLKSLFFIIFPFGINDTKGIIILFVSLVFITFLGFLISQGVGFYFKKKILKISSKFPAISQIIDSLKKFLIILKFSSEIFERPVMVKREQGKEIKFGFVTKTSLEEFGLKDYSGVYLPNPFSFLGEVVIVNNRDLEPVKGDKSDISNFIISGGLINKNKD